MSINFADPNLVNILKTLPDGTHDLIIGHRDSPDQLHIHDHPGGQTLTIYHGNERLAKGTIPPPGIIDFGK